MAERRCVVLTGVSRGLGRAMAQQFADQGHRVIGCARSEADVAQLGSQFGSPHRFDVVDVCDPSQVQRWAAAVLEGGPPDLLINNAALINRSACLWEVPSDEFSRVVDVNIKGMFYVCKYFVPAMIERRRGVVVNFSSTWGRTTSPEVGPYCTTKWAVEGMTRALAGELPRGLAAVPLNPGVIHTGMLESCFGSGAAAYPKPQDWAKRAVPFLLQLGPRDNGQPLTVPAGEKRNM